MPPTFRSSRSGRQLGDGVNRTRTGQIDHDVFEGLPVRRWTRQIQTVSQEPKSDGTESEPPGLGGKQSIPENPMPRDSHLLAPMSRALLRAARSGCIYIRQASKDFEDEEKETTDPEEQQVIQNTERNFSMRKWATVPKHMEPPEVEFLAKRRPGLPSLYGATAGVVEGANGSVPMRKTRFKKVDPVTGNISIYAAWVPEGHKIEGEVTDDSQLAADNSKVTVTPEAPAPGTVIEGVGVVNAQGVVVAEAGSAAVLTPPRRRPPPPKRKAKGLKGRRKKVMFAPGEGTDASLVHGPAAGVGDNTAKDTDSSRMSVDQTTQDDEDDDGEEGEESDDGEGDESGFDAKTPETPGPQPSTEPELKPTPGPAIETVATPASATQVSEAPLATSSVQPPTHPSVPPLDELSRPATDLSSSMPANNPSEVKLAPPETKEDVQMTDAAPADDRLPPSAPVPSTQPQMVSEITQPVHTEKSLSPPHAQQAPVMEPTNIPAQRPEELAVEQPAEPMDIVMAESNVSVSEPAQAATESLEVPTAVPQPPQAEAPEAATVTQNLEPQQDANEFDLLDNLEASLNNMPQETPRDRQQEVSEQRPQDPTQEGAADPKPVVPSQAPIETLTEPRPEETAEEVREPAPEETATPTIPAATLLEPEATASQKQEQRQQQPLPALQSSPPTQAEQQQPQRTLEQASEPHIPSEPLTFIRGPSTIPEQATTEQPARSPQASAPGQAPSEAPAPSAPTAEPPKAQDSPLPPSFPVPAAEQPRGTEPSREVVPQNANEQLGDKVSAKMDVTLPVQPVSEAQIAQPPPSFVRSPPIVSGPAEPVPEAQHGERQVEVGLGQQGQEHEASGNTSLPQDEANKS
ncbi:hypothetical protein BJX68DRAFT_80657 [Aspergillus pseudodeflectus]|uniref:Altered inheritance of mitochondria protein 21 n=1 Tax=Aspergillus pseudodeflectus TaxID=176178 RepID=A0ABR4L9R1_9EURO